MPKGDDLCPLGFAPHSIRPTRCKRCFRDYGEHKKFKEDGSKAEEKSSSSKQRDGETTTKKGTRLAEKQDERGGGGEGMKEKEDDASHQKKTTPNRISPTPNLQRTRSREANQTSGGPAVAAAGSAALVLGEEADATVRRRRPIKEDERGKDENEVPRVRQRTRPGSWSGSSIPSSQDKDNGATTPKSSASVFRGGNKTGKREKEDEEEEKESTGKAASTPRRVQILSAQELRSSLVDESIIPESTSADVEFILQVKTSTFNQERSRYDEEGGDEDDDVSVAATETTETTLTYHDSIEDLQATIQTLKKQCDEWESKCGKLEADKRELQRVKTTEKDEESLEKTAAELLKLRAKIFELESSNEDLRDENNVLKLELKELQEDVDQRPPLEEVTKKMAELRQKLHAAEAMCEELVEENEEYKKEINEMEDEIEEMQDSFREDQADEYRDLRKELEQTAKNCRILQFKLRKTERRCEHSESEKNEVEDKLKLITNADNIDMDKIERIKSLEREVKAAREISNKMHREMETLRAKLKRVEGEKRSDESRLKDEASGQRLVATAEKDEEKKSENDDSAELMRELYDSMEREKDLKEQLKFSEAEATSLRKKLTSLEEENESVMLQLKKMASVRASKGGGKRTMGSGGGGQNRGKDYRKEKDAGISAEDSEEFSMAELKLQMELLEQEARVLRKKLKEMEEENESLSKEIKFLEGALGDKTTTTTVLTKQQQPAPVGRRAGDVYDQQRIELLENEAKELRRKLIEKERENEQWATEAAASAKSSRRGSKTVPTVQRSRSLDSDVQIDLRRQLQLVEQEAGILRQKTLDLEKENDELCAENRKLQIRGHNKKSPPTSNEKLALENLELKETVAALEKKVQQQQQQRETKNQEETSSSDSTTTKDAGGSSSAAAAKKGLLSIRLKEQVSKLESEMAVLKKRVAELEKENNSLKKLKNSTNYERRTSRTITEASSKQEMRRYIEELEEELNSVSSTEALKTKHVEELREAEKKSQRLSEQLEEETKKKKLAEEEKLEIIKKMEIAEKTNSRAQKKFNDGEINTLKKKLESLEKEFANEKQSHGEMKKKISDGELVDFEALRKVEEEKHKLRKEIVENEKKSSDLERKIGELERTAKECGKTQRSLKRELEEARKELENERMKLKKVDSRQSEVAVGWLKEREELKKQMAEIERLSVEQLEQESKKYRAKIDELENEMAEEKKRVTKTIKEKDGELKRLKEQLEAGGEAPSAVETEYLEKWNKLEAIYKKETEEWMTTRANLEGELMKEKKRRERMDRDHESELKDRDEDMLTLKDKIRRAETEVKRMSEQRGDTVGHLEDELKELRKELVREKREYEDLTAKYELLEEDYVLVKARGVMAKEQVQSNFNALRRDHTEVEGELKTLRETFNIRQDTWIKEKLDMQEKIKELSGKLSRTNASSWDIERARLKDLVEEKSSLNEVLKKDIKDQKEEMERLKRQVEETKRMLDDYARVKSYRKNVSGGEEEQLTFYENEIENLKSKLQQEEKAHRSELASTKMIMEQRVAQLQDEIHALHLQNAKVKRERETFKEMLDGAQKTIADLKTGTIGKDKSTKIMAEIDETKHKLEQTRKEKEEILDRLDVSERNCSRIKTEYVTERASWEIKTAEMQTRINELEETTILQGGRSKIFGVKTKLELAWQKEREEQHRLLTESHKMARDLKQRLLDVESARDKERLESKRQLDELRKTIGDDREDARAKMEELQKDQLDTRDAQSKMRASMDRIKREKARMEGERDELRVFVSEMQRIHSRDRMTIGNLIEELREIKHLVPPILDDDAAAADTGGIDKHSKVSSRSSDNDDGVKRAFKAALNRISIAADELWRAHGTREEDRVRRNLSFRRAISEDEDDDGGGLPRTAGNIRRRDDPLSRWQNPQRVTNYPASPPSMYISVPRRQPLYRKALSLDQSVNVDSADALGQTSSIWKSADSGGSNSSIPGENSAAPTPSPRLKKHLRKVRQQSSMDSDISDTSASSSRDISVERDASLASNVATKQTRSGGIKEKLKRLTKAKSIEGTPTADQIRQAGFQALGPALGNAGSSSSVTSETNVRKEVKGKDLKSRIANLFKKTSSQSSLDKHSLDGDGGGKSNTLRPKSSSIATKTSISSGGGKAETLPRYGSASAIDRVGKK